MKSRSLKSIPLDERRQILLELETEKSGPVRARHGINNQVLSHIRHNHGPHAPARKGDYYKNLVAGYVSPELALIRELKHEGKTSGQAAEILNIPLERVNLAWPRA